VAPDTTAPLHRARRVATPAGVVVTRRVGVFALACLHVARVGALLNVLAVLAVGALVASNSHPFVAAFLVLLGVPVSIGHFVAFGLIIEYARTE
jgi:hypothetical protein